MVVVLTALRVAGSGIEDELVDAVTAGISKTLKSLIGGQQGCQMGKWPSRRGWANLKNFYRWDENLLRGEYTPRRLRRRALVSKRPKEAFGGRG